MLRPGERRWKEDSQTAWRRLCTTAFNLKHQRSLIEPRKFPISRKNIRFPTNLICIPLGFLPRKSRLQYWRSWDSTKFRTNKNHHRSNYFIPCWTKHAHSSHEPIKSSQYNILKREHEVGQGRQKSARSSFAISLLFLALLSKMHQHQQDTNVFPNWIPCLWVLKQIDSFFREE